MIRRILIILLGGMASLIFAISVATFTIGSTTTNRVLYRFMSTGTKTSHYTTELIFINKRFKITSERKSFRPLEHSPGYRSKSKFEISEWGSARFPTLWLVRVDNEFGEMVNRDYLFDSTAESLLLVAGILGFYPAISLFRGPVRRHRRRRRGLCIKCGYNLTGNTTGVCPECGTAF